MEKKVLYGASDIAVMLGVSKSKAYKMIKDGNEHLKQMHKLTIAGKTATGIF